MLRSRLARARALAMAGVIAGLLSVATTAVALAGSGGPPFPK